MVFAGSLPQAGQNAQVTLDGLYIRVNLDKYQVSKADRFGQKISEGDLRYQDFNPFESAESISNTLQGAGVIRMSDVEHTLNLAQPYKESSGVNASGTPIVLAPLQVLETLPGSTATPITVFEFVPSSGINAGLRLLLCLAGTKVFIRNASGSGAWTDSGLALPAVPLKQAVAVFKGYIIFGFGAAHTAVATPDLVTLVNVTDTVPANQFIFAIAADRAASYIAGGSSASNTNQIISSTNPISGYTGAVQCDSGSGGNISGLAPGGGVAILFVGKDTELGNIDLTGVYNTLVPFDTRWPTNCIPLKWWMGLSGQEQRGPLSLVFPRERSLWNYVPSSLDAGSAADISPWSNPVVHPPTSKGAVTAIQGTARWLYFTVTTAAGHSWVWRRDSAPNAAGQNASHTYLDLGVTPSNCLSVSGVTSATGNPMLFMGTGNNVTSIILPIDGFTELDDSNCRFTSTGTLYASDIDLGFPDEDKVAFTMRLIADQSLSPSGQTIDVQFAYDGGAYQDLGTIDSSPAELQFPSATIGKRLSTKLILNTNDPGLTPQLWAFSVRVSLNPKLYRLVEFEGVLSSGGFFGTGADDMTNPKTAIDQLWADVQAGIPVPFADRWGDNYMARILDFSEQQSTMQPDATPETTITAVLLIASGPTTKPTSAILYDTPEALYDVPTSVYSS